MIQLAYGKVISFSCEEIIHGKCTSLCLAMVRSFKIQSLNVLKMTLVSSNAMPVLPIVYIEREKNVNAKYKT